MNQEKKKKLIVATYKDPERPFSIKKIYNELKKTEKGITLKLVKETLSELNEYQLNSKVDTNVKYSSIYSMFPGSNLQCDVMYLPNPLNNRKYMFNVIDVYSRKLFYRITTRRKGEVFFKAFTDILDNDFPIVNNMNLDNEFKTKQIIEYCEGRNIKLYFSDPEQSHKNAIVERVHRTIREAILNWQNANKNKNYYPVLKKLIDTYNNTIHTTTNQKPSDLFNNYPKVLSEQTYERVEHDFSVGDIVKKLIKKKQFDKKSSTNQFSTENYEVISVNHHKIFLKNLKTNRELSIPAKYYELKKII